MEKNGVGKMERSGVPENIIIIRGFAVPHVLGVPQ